MKGINKAIILGTLGRDPEIRYTQSGNAVANLNLATNESWTDKATGQKQEKTEWHRAVIFGKLAEIAAQYLTKGSQIYIEGKLQTRKWTDQQTGIERYSTEIVLDPFNGVMQMVGGRPNQAQNAQMGGGTPPMQNGPSMAAQAPANGQNPQTGQQPSPAPEYVPQNFDDDDVPFSLKATWPELIAYV